MLKTLIYLHYDYNASCFDPLLLFIQCSAIHEIQELEAFHPSAWFSFLHFHINTTFSFEIVAFPSWIIILLKKFVAQTQTVFYRSVQRRKT